MFQSTRPVWGATALKLQLPAPVHVSIHAPRVGRDPCNEARCLERPVSIHAPRVGRDWSYLEGQESRICFNPRAPCGARRAFASLRYPSRSFQSTRPVWGATAHERSVCMTTRVSIHAPRVGRDPRRATSMDHVRCFNPRAPCGARHAPIRETVARMLFQSTRPVWGATLLDMHQGSLCVVSIHAPRVGRDE